MKKKILWILLIGLLSATCKIECPNCVKPHYVEKDRTPILHMGDTIVFKSNTNAKDTFLVSNINKKEFYTDKTFTSDYYVVEYTLCNYDCPFKDYNECPNYAFVVEWDRTYIRWRYLYKGVMSNSLSTDLEINGNQYFDVKNVSIDTAKLNSEDVVKVCFNDQQGILSYTLKSGEYFERIK